MDMMDYNQDNFLPANLGGVPGFGLAEVKEAAFGETENRGVFAFDTFDAWTLKDYLLGRTRCAYRGLWVQEGQRYIATVDVVITEFNPGSSLSFRAVTAPSSLRPI